MEEVVDVVMVVGIAEMMWSWTQTFVWSEWYAALKQNRIATSESEGTQNNIPKENCQARVATGSSEGWKEGNGGGSLLEIWIIW